MTPYEIDTYAKPIFDRLAAETYQKELSMPDIRRLIIELFNRLGKSVPSDNDIACIFQLYDHDFSGRLSWPELQDMLKVMGGLQDPNRQRIINNKAQWRQPGGLYN